MKVIQSAGGPLIAIDCNLAQLWSANTGKSFIGAAAHFADDYGAVGYLPDGTLMPPWSIALFQGVKAEALLISMPLETAIIKNEQNSVYIAQVQFGEAEWSFSDILVEYFDKADFGESVYFQSKNCSYVIFDSAFLLNEVGDQFLNFQLSEGKYVFSSACYQPDKFTSLILIRIIRADHLSNMLGHNHSSLE